MFSRKDLRRSTIFDRAAQPKKSRLRKKQRVPKNRVRETPKNENCGIPVSLRLVNSECDLVVSWHIRLTFAVVFV
jgi:hypothetical protein